MNNLTYLMFESDGGDWDDSWQGFSEIVLEIVLEIGDTEYQM
jgi:hypothetical protein